MIILAAVVLSTAGSGVFLSHPGRAAANSAITLRVQVGLAGIIRPGRLAPIEVMVSNSGDDISGTLLLTGRLDAVSAAGITKAGVPESYSKSVVIPNYSSKQYTFYVPVPYAVGATSVAPLLLNPSLTLSFLVNEALVAAITSAPFSLMPAGARLTPTAPLAAGAAQGTIAPVIVVPPTGFLVGVLSRHPSLVPRLANLSLMRHLVNGVILPLNTAQFPSVPAVLANLDVLIFENYATQELSPSQRSGLESWVAAGGTLIVVGGQHWQETTAGLPPSMLPVEVNDILTFPRLGGLLPFLRTYRPVLSLPKTAALGAFLMSKGTLRFGRVLLSEQNIPVVVEGMSGQGRVLYLAVETETEPLVNWPGTTTLWQTLLARSLLSHNLSPLQVGTDIPFNTTSISGALNNLPGMELGSPVLLLWVLLLYVLVIGPLNYAVLHRLRRSGWGWYTIPGCILVFSLFAYGLAFTANGNTVRLNEVSIVRLDPASHLKHIRSFYGLFVPGNGTYTLQLPGQPHILSTPSETTVSVRQSGASNDLTLAHLQQWKMYMVGIEDQLPLTGEISSDLRIREGHLIGTIKNNTSFTISDPKLIAGVDVQLFPELQPGEQQDVNIPLHVPSSSAPLLSPLTVLANLYPTQEGYSSSTPEQRVLALKGNLIGGVHGQVNPAVLSAYNGDDLNSGALSFVGWTNQAPLPGLVNGYATPGAAATLLIAPLQVKANSPSALLWPVFVPRIITADTEIEPGLPAHQDDTVPGVIDEFELPVNGVTAYSGGLPPTATLTIELSEQVLREAGQDSLGTTLTIECYNWRTGRWVNIALDTLKGEVVITSAENRYFVSPQGILLVRLASKIAHGTALLDLGKSILLDVRQGRSS